MEGFTKTSSAATSSRTAHTISPLFPGSSSTSPYLPI